MGGNVAFLVKDKHMYGRPGGDSRALLKPALDVCEYSVSHSGRFTKGPNRYESRDEEQKPSPCQELNSNFPVRCQSLYWLIMDYIKKCG
jgi:hypothetical protein